MGRAIAEAELGTQRCREDRGGATARALELSGERARRRAGGRFSMVEQKHGASNPRWLRFAHVRARKPGTNVLPVGCPASVESACFAR